MRRFSFYLTIFLYSSQIIGQTNLMNTVVQQADDGEYDLVLSELTAFPGAKGLGRFSKGGRGGVVEKVTNLNDSGPGSFKAAYEKSYPRYIVFDVAGIVIGNDNDNGNLTQIGNVSGGFPNVTIEGATSPGEGIEFHANMINIRGGSNYIFRNLRMMGGFGNANGGTYKNIRMRLYSNDPNASKIMVDRCLLMYANDENFSVYDLENANNEISNISVTSCITSKGKYQSLVYYSSSLSFIGNITAHGNRNLAYSSTAGNDYKEILNNYVYDFYWNLIGLTAGEDGDWIGNVGKILRTPANTQYLADMTVNSNSPNNVPSDSDIYLNDNVVVNYSFLNQYDADISGVISAQRVGPGKGHFITTAWPSGEVVAKVTSTGSDGAGYKPWDRGTTQNALLSDIASGSGSNATSATVRAANWVGYADNPASSTRPVNYDSIADGIPDSFSIQHGITNHNQVIQDWNFNGFKVKNEAGYEAIEMYFFWLNKHFE